MLLLHNRKLILYTLTLCYYNSFGFLNNKGSLFFNFYIYKHINVFPKKGKANIKLI